MRYAIIGATVEQVRSAGGSDIKEAGTIGIIFATLTREQADRLRATGCQVTKVGTVQAGVYPPVPVRPPVPIVGVPTYTGEDVFEIARFETVRTVTIPPLYVTIPPLYGEGMNVAVIGSGIRETHELIQGRVVYQKNLTSAPMRDDFDHDTGVASIIVNIVPNCNILNMKVLDEKGNGTEEEVAMAFDDLLTLFEQKSEHAPHVVNLSLGGPDDGNPNSPMRVACRAAIAKGIWVVAAAGNGGPVAETITSPATEEYVAAVGSASYLASQQTFAVSNFSSRGPTKEQLIKPDVIMFGENILMASSSSDSAKIGKTGTSFSAAVISAISILFLEGVAKYTQITGAQFPPEMYNLQEIMDKYIPTVCIKPAGAPAAKDNDCGYGLPYGVSVAQKLGTLPTTTAVNLSTVLNSTITIGALALVGMMLSSMSEELVATLRRGQG